MSYSNLSLQPLTLSSEVQLKTAVKYNMLPYSVEGVATEMQKSYRVCVFWFL